MFNDEFRLQYSRLRFATFWRKHKKGTVKQDITTLSHKHREMELMTILSGRAKICIDTKAYEIEKGDVVIISPYLLHNATIYSDFDFEHYCLCFDLKIIPDAGLGERLEKGFYKIDPIIKGGSGISKELVCCVKGAFDAHAQQKDGWELKVIGHLSVFFGLLKEGKNICREEENTEAADICYRIIDYIDKNYTEKITSADAAQALYMSKSYFCRIFKRNFGHCFQNYICMYRIEKAKILLKTTDLPVSDIAMQVGFNSFSFFSKMFKEYLQLTPSEYRKDEA